MRVEYKGMRNLQYLTERLDNIEESKAIKAGLRAGARYFIALGRRNLRQRLKGTSKRGNLLRSMTTLLKRRDLGALAGFRRGRYRSGGRFVIANHAHLVDLGTDKRYRKKSDRYTGIMPANYFWTDAFDEGQAEAGSRVYEGVRMFVQRLGERR